MARLARRPGEPRPSAGPRSWWRAGSRSRGGSWLRIGNSSVAGQVFLFQAVIVLLLVAAAATAVVLQAHRDSQQEATNRSLAVAGAFANSPGMVAALRSPDPTAILQPRAEAARKISGVDFVVVTNPQGIRYTHPNPARIGQHFVGNLKPAQAGHPFTARNTGTLGPAVYAVVPVFGPGHKVVGLVSAGITIAKVSTAVEEQLPVLLGAAAGGLLLATAGTAFMNRRLRRQTHGLGPTEMTRMYEHHDAVLHAVREGVLIVGGDGRLLLVNDEAALLLGLPPNPEGRYVSELGLAPETARLLTSEQVADDEVVNSGERQLVVNRRPTDRAGGPPGWVTTLRDSTELRALSGRAERARGRLTLLYEASTQIGTTLDVTRTAEELARVAVPRFADFVTVDLAEPVLRGEEPGPATATGSGLRRIAVHGIAEESPLYRVGVEFSLMPSTPQSASLAEGEPVLTTDLRSSDTWRRHDHERGELLMAYGFHSFITVPLLARGVMLGMVNFWRAQRPEPFEQDDISLAGELAGRAAVCIDNARRYTHEHTMAVVLQHSLLPNRLPEQSALDLAYRYLPAESGVGGDWFDVLALPGARVALVVGDVVGHGLHAAATMGRLRTAVANFSALDLPPEELLGHLDELVSRIDEEEEGADGRGEDDAAARPSGGRTAVTGATCVYAVYDPASGLCTVARAGHPPPALVHPDGTAEFLDLPAGLPLGIGGQPYETTEFTLEEGSRLVLYTDGLIEDRAWDIDVGFEHLRTALSGRPGHDPEATCRAVLDALVPDRPSDDIAVLVARARRLDTDRIAEWTVPHDPAAVAAVRAEVSRRLTAWGLEEAAFTTELVLSELITNAIRYASGPIGVRLLRDRTLICEVSDTSSTSPHLRAAAATDEGGRGLFLVAQFADRWGTRYTAHGKVIWTETALPRGGGPHPF
ncbi:MULTISPECIES: SpoIIE family protein phosphatase [unclassified Streptomyces]|uniref:SpoIIE family protein phosphatase n=1 Tax=unclassified Streptomyces TaxID=2593676 RepID=UPI002E7991D4|nr:SpoIIE family protein phosphatase [Streptomyces sp. JV176]MEE1799050.1 SpoIIE family protein phosphatase [Streptomyces sp. JV176]